MAQFISRSVRLVVQVARFPDGARRVTSIAEVGEQDAERVHVHEVFQFSPSQNRFIYNGGSGMNERFLDHGVKFQLS